jgi:hypothetical protein
LVERNLAKVEVAGSNPVIRSEDGFGRPLLTKVSATWPSGQARVCKTLYPGSIPGVASSGYNAHNGRLAQRQSAASTRQRSAVQFRQRPPRKPLHSRGFWHFGVSAGSVRSGNDGEVTVAESGAGQKLGNPAAPRPSGSPPDRGVQHHPDHRIATHPAGYALPAIAACRCHWLWDSSKNGGSIRIRGPRMGPVSDELDQIKAIVDCPGRC